MLSEPAELDPASGSDPDGEPLWFNEPRRWRHAGTELVLFTDPHTDFWRQTHYGFIRDNGHHFGARRLGDFVAQVEVNADYRSQYDQAGLMVRLDAGRWVKCGLELVDGAPLVSAVVTHAVSDWSTAALTEVPQWLGLRLTRERDALRIEYRTTAAEGSPGPWQTHRLAYLPPALAVAVGPMAASPQGGGMQVRFKDFRIAGG